MFSQDDYESIWNVVAFLLAFACCVFQVNSSSHSSLTLDCKQKYAAVHLSLTLLRVNRSVVPPLPFPLICEETEVLHSVKCDRPMQLAPARLEKRVAAPLPRFRCLLVYRAHPDSQSSRQNQRLWRLRSAGQRNLLHRCSFQCSRERART